MITDFYVLVFFYLVFLKVANLIIKFAPLKKIFLEVYKNNSAAIHIYQKYGFTTELTKDKTIVMSKMVK